MGYWKIVFDAKELSLQALPGQFCQLKVPGVFLRRPLSISLANSGEVEFIYRVVGSGTNKLSELKLGQKISVLGPLGNAYPLENLKNKTPILVAGGTGIASLSFLVSKLKGNCIVFYGARTEKDIIQTDFFKKIGCKVFVATEDGSAGTKGFVTDIFEEMLTDYKNPVVYTCGPNAMMLKVAEICKRNKINGYASLEEKMACGTGVCQGCVVKIKGEYKRVCADGPVFEIDSIVS